MLSGFLEETKMLGFNSIKMLESMLESFWQVLSNSLFDRMAGRAETSKRTLGRLEHELPGVPK